MTRALSSIKDGGWDEPLLDLVVRTAADGVIVCDEHGAIRAYSRSCVRMFQYTPNETVGGNIRMLVPDDSDQEIEKQLKRLTRWSESRRPHVVREVMGRRKDGSVFPMFISISCGRLHGKQAFVGIVHELTELHHDRRRKEQHAALLSQMIESSQEGIVGASADGVIRTFNRAAEAIYGYAAAKLIGKSIFKLMMGTVRPEHLAEEEQMIGRVLAGEAIPPYEALRVRRDGTLVHVLTSLSPIRDERRNVAGFTQSLRDISSHKAQEEQNAFMSSIVQSSNEAIIGVALDGTVRSYNRGAEVFYGYEADEIIGTHVRDLVPLTVPAECEAEALDLLARIYAGEAITPLETVRIRKDGSRVPVLLSVTYIRDANGRLLGSAQIARDISQRKQYEAYLREMGSQLVHVGRLNELGQLSAGIAHELNQPLAAMLNYISVAKRMAGSGNNADVRKALDLIERAAEQARRAGVIIRRIRGFVERRETTRRIEDIAAIIDDALAVEMSVASAETIATKLHIGPDLPKVYVDRLQLQQLLVNLLHNAVEAMARSARRELTISAIRTEKDEVEISVADSGPGIPEFVADRMFMPFFTTKPGALGMGLAVAQSIAEAHGGHIEAASGEEGGAVLRLKLARAPDGTPA